MIMMILDIIFAIYWIVMAISAWCGHLPSNLSIGCGFLCASLGFLYMALDRFKNRKK